MTSVLLVCLGNICRSPTAEGVLRAMCEAEGVGEQLRIDSAGTGGWHVGNPPDPRAIAAAAKRGVDLSCLRARQATAEDFHDFDFILAMDSSNYRDLEALRPQGSRAILARFLSFAGAGAPIDVPDPYYGGDDGFDAVLDLIEEASSGFIEHLRSEKLVT